MKVLLINGSPKTRNSSTELILKHTELLLSDYCEINTITAAKPYTLETEKLVQACDAMVIAFPLYVDAVPSHLLRYLRDVSKTVQACKKNLTVYPVVNCGFYEARQNRLALDVIKMWCFKSGITYGQGIGLGAGPILGFAPIGRGPNTNIGKVLSQIVENIKSGACADNIFAEPNFPRFLYKAAAHSSWKKHAKNNGLSVKDMYKKISDS